MPFMDRSAKGPAASGAKRNDVEGVTQRRSQAVIGTLEEFFEVLTWAQLGLHPKPCGLLNVSGYYDRLLEFLDLTVEERFVKSQHRALVITSTSPTDLLERFATYRPPQVEKWIDRATS